MSYRSRAMTPGSWPEDIRWGTFDPSTDITALVDQVNREDLCADAAKAVSADQPTCRNNIARPERFFDGKVFDPANPSAYLKSLAIKRSHDTPCFMRAPIDQETFHDLFRPTTRDAAAPDEVAPKQKPSLGVLRNTAVERPSATRGSRCEPSCAFSCRP